MSTVQSPVVFVSHASEDKARFVIALATKLREHGIDAWLDRWEIFPGDSLVDKIFEEGLKRAHAVIVVLSKNSIAKKWVREELNAGVVARIERGTRLIPIVLDDVEVPESLRNTVWVRITDSDSFCDELARIVATIFGFRSKPPLGQPPKYTKTELVIAGLQAQDVVVLKLFCEHAMQTPYLFEISTATVAAAAEREGVSNDQFLESLQVLSEAQLLEGRATLTRDHEVTTQGFEKYVQAAMPTYPAIYRSVAAEIVNHGTDTHHDLAAALGEKLVVVAHVLNMMAADGLIQLERAGIDYYRVSDVSPRLRRFLQGGA